ncbi:MAG: S-methyl-5'-thioadenosine phosphorylase, partial [Nitrosotalea sp.]
VVSNVAKKMNLHINKDATYICIEGPRFSTRAESKFYKNVIGADIIGMTLVPECQLAREAQMCYVSISTVTDYDVWADKPVTAKEVLETLSKNVGTTKNILSLLFDSIPEQRGCLCHKAFEEAQF